MRFLISIIQESISIDYQNHRIVEGEIVMPGYRTHIVGGIGTFTALFYFFQKVSSVQCAFLTALSCFFVTILGSLFPDVDTKSKGQMIFYQGLLLYLLFLLWAQKFKTFMIITCLFMLPLLVPHRGLFHRIWFLTFLAVGAGSVVFFCFPTQSYDLSIHILFFYVGALSHVFLDKFQTAIKF